MGVLRVVAWNCKVNRPPGDVANGLRNLIQDQDPDVVCLQEAGDYVSKIKQEFGVDHGGAWRVYCHNDWTKANDCPVMVHKRFNAKTRGDPDGWNTIRTKTEWTGPSGHTHKGRTWTWVKVDSRFVCSFHRCTGGKGKNKASAKEEYDVMCEWISDRTDERIIVLGDHNIGPQEQDPYWSSWGIADHCHGSTRFDNGDAGIDYAICRNQKGDVVRTKTYGSDHKAVRIVAEA